MTCGKRAPDCGVASELYRIAGEDLTDIPSVSAANGAGDQASIFSPPYISYFIGRIGHGFVARRLDGPGVLW